VGRIWVLYHHFDIASIPSVIAAAERLLDDTPAHRVLRGELEFFRGYICYFQNEGARALEHLERALGLLPSGHSEARGQTELLHGLTMQMRGREEEALGALKEALDQANSSRSIRITRLQVSTVYIHVISGDLDLALVANQQLREYAGEHGFAYAEAWGFYLQGLIHFLRNELEQASIQFRRAVERRYVLHDRAAVDAMLGLAMAYQAMGQRDHSDTAVGYLAEYVGARDEAPLSVLHQSCGARMSVMRGDTDAAVKWVKAAPRPAVENMVWWLEIPTVTYCRALLAEGTETALRRAAETLDECLARNQANHNTCHTIGVLTLLALVFEKQGFEDKALKSLKRALALVKPGGIIRPFVELGPPMAGLLGRLKPADADVDQVGEILAALGKAGRGADPSGSGLRGTRSAIEGASEDGDARLTQRELEILSLVAEGWSNKQVAAELYISAETVKKHLYNTYQKLGADSRITALSKARELGLLSTDLSSH
jgi:LuxR family maltose regulon positive regulatory protein